MKILAIDPGTSYCGVAMVSGAGEWLEKETIKLDHGLEMNQRLEQAQRRLHGLLRYWGEPDVLVLEDYAVYGLKGSVANGFVMGRVVQAMIDTAVDYCAGLRVDTVPAREVRRYICGNVSAKSSQIREGLRLMGYSQRSNEHERDALALALYWLEKQRQGTG